MHREPPAIDIVSFFTQEVKQLCINHGNQEIKGGIRIGHNQKQGCLLVSQRIQFQIVVGSDFPKFRNVKWGQSGTAGNQNGFCGFARCQFVQPVLPVGKGIGLFTIQILKHQVYRILKFFIILPYLHGVQ